MRILLVAPQVPWPAHQGTAIRNAAIARELAQRHEVTLLAFAAEAQAAAHDAVPDGLRVIPVPAPPARSTARRVLDLPTTGIPDLARRLDAPAFGAAIYRLADEPTARPFDIVQIEGLEMAEHGMAAAAAMEASSGTRPQRIYDAHNAEWVLQDRAWRADIRRPSGWPGALYSRVQTWKLRRYERRLLRAVDATVAVSEADAAALRALAPDARILVVPNGVDVDDRPTRDPRSDGDPLPLGASVPAEGPAPRQDSSLPEVAKPTTTPAPRDDPSAGEKADTCLFIGKMDFRPNVDAMTWLCQETWPLVRERRPAARLWIVGRNPSPRVRSLHEPDDGVEVVGSVPEVEPWLQRAAVVIVPLRIGGGTRLKVLEAMAAGKAIAATTMAVEGLTVRHGREALLADDPVALADAVVRLLEDEGLRRRLGAAARATAAERYRWSALVPHMEALYTPAEPAAQDSPPASDPAAGRQRAESDVDPPGHPADGNHTRTPSAARPADRQVQAWRAATEAHDAAHAAREARRARWLRRMPGASRRPPLAIEAAVGGDLDGRGDAWRGLPAAPRILWLQPDHLGDVLLRGPALGALRQRLPNARIELVVGPWSEGVARRMPDVDIVTTVRHPTFERSDQEAEGGGSGTVPRGLTRRLRPYLRLLRALWWLRRKQADAVVIGRDDDWWSAWLAALAGVPLRLGHATATLTPFLTHALPIAARPDHVADGSLALVGGGTRPLAKARGLRWRVDAPDRQRAGALLGPLAEAAPLAIHPGSGSPIKRWRPEAWAAVARQLAGSSAPVIVTGGPTERALAARVAEAVAVATGGRVLDLAGRTDLATLAAVYARCRLVLGPDSGPLHLATAIGTPTVHLYGPSDAARFGPWGPPALHRALASDLPCAPCARLDWPRAQEHACVRAMSVDDVLEAAEHALAASWRPLL